MLSCFLAHSILPKKSKFSVKREALFAYPVTLLAGEMAKFSANASNEFLM